MIPIAESMNTRAADLLSRKEPQFKALGIDSTRHGRVEVLDFGNGGQTAGVLFGRACLADLAGVDLSLQKYPELGYVPTITVTTDHPALAALGCQEAGWLFALDDSKSTVPVSGPARILRGKEEVLERLQLSVEDFNPQVVVALVESKEPPGKEDCDKMLEELKLAPGKRLVVASTRLESSWPGSLNIACRVGENPLHRLLLAICSGDVENFELEWIRTSLATVPVSQPCPDWPNAFHRTNSALICAGVVHLSVSSGVEKTLEDDELRAVFEPLLSTASEVYSEPFGYVVRDLRFDFTEIEKTGIFSVPCLIIHNMDTGNTLTLGEPDYTRLATEFRRKIEY